MKKLTFVPAALLTLWVFGCMPAQPTAQSGGVPQRITDCRVIDAPGPYIVINDLPGPGGLLTGAEAGFVDAGDCLAIDVNGVSIDGQGFTMTGDGTSDGSGDGVRVSSSGGNATHIEVRNLTIAKFERGVDLEGAFFSIIENVTAIDNATHGITIHSGQSNRVADNNSISNGVAGIRVSLKSIVKPAFSI